MEQKHTEPPCNLCSAKCCQYYSLEIDKPTTIGDFENIKWYIIHGDSYVYVDEGSWYLQVNSRCNYLLPDNRCGIYEHRPSICREYGFDEDGDVMCDYVTKNLKHELELHNPEDVDNYLKQRFPRTTFPPTPDYKALYESKLKK